MLGRGAGYLSVPPRRFLSRPLVSMLISASQSLGRRNAGPASALMSGDRDKLHERQREGDTRDCPPNGHGAPCRRNLGGGL